MSKQNITIVTAADSAYVPHVGAMLHSLFTTNEQHNFKIHFLHRPDIDPSHIRMLAQLCNHFNADWFSHPVERSRISHFPISESYPEEAWYRLIMPELLDDVDRILWLDADVIVLTDIGPLWSEDTANSPLAAVPNVLPYATQALPEKLGIADRRDYFNSGVLIMQLDQLREERATQAFNEFVNQHREIIVHADQDVLNAIYHKRWARLPLRWNVIATTYYYRRECMHIHGKTEYLHALEQPNIVHFTGGKRLKPWSYSSPHPYRDTYMQHRAAAGWPLPKRHNGRLWDSLTRRIPIRWLALASMLRKGQIRDFLATV